MKTHLSLTVVVAPLILAAACTPEDRADAMADPGDPERVATVDAFGDPAQVPDVPDSLAFAMVDQNEDSVIEQHEFYEWLEAQSAFADEAPVSDSAAVPDSAAGAPPVWSEDLDLTLSELEWQNSGRYLYTRTSEPGLFDDWDTDGDLRLDPLEALAGLDARGEDAPLETDPITSRRQLADVLFRLWDIDGNGTLEPDEYRGGVAVWWM